MTTFRITITLDLVAEDQESAEVAVMDDFFYNPAEFEYEVAVEEVLD